MISHLVRYFENLDSPPPICHDLRSPEVVVDVDSETVAAGADRTYHYPSMSRTGLQSRPAIAADNLKYVSGCPGLSKDMPENGWTSSKYGQDFRQAVDYSLGEAEKPIAGAPDPILRRASAAPPELADALCEVRAVLPEVQDDLLEIIEESSSKPSSLYVVFWVQGEPLLQPEEKGPTTVQEQLQTLNAHLEQGNAGESSGRSYHSTCTACGEEGPIAMSGIDGTSGNKEAWQSYGFEASSRMHVCTECAIKASAAREHMESNGQRARWNKNSYYFFCPEEETDLPAYLTETLGPDYSREVKRSLFGPADPEVLDSTMTMLVMNESDVGAEEEMFWHVETSDTKPLIENLKSWRERQETNLSIREHAANLSPVPDEDGIRGDSDKAPDHLFNTLVRHAIRDESPPTRRLRPLLQRIDNSSAETVAEEFFTAIPTIQWFCPMDPETTSYKIGRLLALGDHVYNHLDGSKARMRQRYGTKLPQMPRAVINDLIEDLWTRVSQIKNEGFRTKVSSRLDDLRTEIDHPPERMGVEEKSQYQHGYHEYRKKRFSAT